MTRSCIARRRLRHQAALSEGSGSARPVPNADTIACELMPQVGRERPGLFRRLLSWILSKSGGAAPPPLKPAWPAAPPLEVPPKKRALSVERLWVERALLDLNHRMLGSERPEPWPNFVQPVPAALLRGDTVSTDDLSGAAHELILGAARRIGRLDVPVSRPRIEYTSSLPPEHPGQFRADDHGTCLGTRTLCGPARRLTRRRNPRTSRQAPRVRDGCDRIASLEGPLVRDRTLWERPRPAGSQDGRRDGAQMSGVRMAQRELLAQQSRGCRHTEDKSGEADSSRT